MNQPVNVTVVQKNQGCGCVSGLGTLLLLGVFVFSGAAGWLFDHFAGLAIAACVGLVVLVAATAAIQKGNRS